MSTRNPPSFKVRDFRVSLRACGNVRFPERAKRVRRVTIFNEMRSIARLLISQAIVIIILERRGDHFHFPMAELIFLALDTARQFQKSPLWSLSVTSREIAHLSRRITIGTGRAS